LAKEMILFNFIEFLRNSFSQAATANLSENSKD
jgi:hypothetical protein